MKSDLSQPIEFECPGGVVLRGDAWGNPDDPAVVLLHGGGQTRHSWGKTAQALADAGWWAVALDQRGHGDSDWAEDGDYRFEIFTQDLVAVLESFHRRPAVVGASLGGIVSLMVEGRAQPGSLSSLVLVDITPRFEAEGVGRIIDFMRSRPDGFASLEEAAEAVASYLPHRPAPKSTSGLKKNLRLGKDGRYRWHWDSRLMDPDNLGGRHGSENLLYEAAASLKIPTLLVRGKLSDIVSEKGVDEFMKIVPHAEFVDVSDAGHMVAGDSNDIFSDAVITFLKKHHDDEQ